MAKIPVKRQGGGIPWWVWLLIVLIVLALIWWLFVGFGDNEVEGAAMAASVMLAARYPRSARLLPREELESETGEARDLRAA